MAAQVRPTHAARVIEMGEGAFDLLAPLTHQAPAASGANPATISDTPRLGLGRLRPIASSAIGLRDVGPDAHGVEVDHRLIAVIALVRNDLFQRLRLVRRRPARLRSDRPRPSPSRRSSSCRPASAPCSVTATIAPVSRSTACSALWARCVRPSFIFVTFASGSDGLVQSLFEVFFFRFRSSRAKSSRVGVSIPDVFASPVKKA